MAAPISSGNNPELIRSNPLENRPSPFKSFMRTLPAWLASAAINAALIFVFMLVIDLQPAESNQDKRKRFQPPPEPPPPPKAQFNFENIDIGDDPDREINYDTELKAVPTPGEVDPSQAVGTVAQLPTPVPVPPPPGLSQGQGSQDFLKGGKLPLMGAPGGHLTGVRYHPGGMTGRSGATKQRALIEGGGNTKTEAAVARGLRWLAYHQAFKALPGGLIGGYWSLSDFPKHASGPFLKYRNTSTGVGRTGNDVAGTAFGMLPFLAAGMTHKNGLWQKNVLAAAQWMIDKQDKTSGKYDGNMYAHGLATIAMCELYGLSSDKRVIGASAQKALNFIAYAQDPASGGWRYSPRQGGDTSVVGWQLMALKSGQMSGLNVPKASLDGAAKWLDSCETLASLEIERGPGNPNPTRQPSGQFGYTGPGGRPTMSSVGLLCRQYLGVERENPSLLNGVCLMDVNYRRGQVNNDFLNPVHPHLKDVGIQLARAAKQDEKGNSNVFGARFPMKSHYNNMYFLYYATQVMHHMNNEFWDDWNLGIWVDPDGKQVRVHHLLRYDGNGDGLTKEELLKADEGDNVVRTYLEAEWNRVVRADRDGDGKLTEAELKHRDYLRWIPGMRETMLAYQNVQENAQFLATQGIPYNPANFGSWDPKSDRHGSAGGRIMKTSLCLLTLEVYYRHLPLYRRELATGKPKMAAEAPK